MIDIVKKFFSKPTSDHNASTKHSTAHDIQVAVCALCIEIARIDEKFTQQELDTLLSILIKKYNLSSDNAEALMAAANQALEDSVDLWQFAQLINEHYAIDEKLEIVEMLWQIVYVDGKMDQHEHYLMNKLSSLLRMTHKQLIDAKLKVLHQNK